MTDFLLELRSEEIPARMQAKARDDLAKLFAAELDKAGLHATEIVMYSTPRRLALIALGLPLETPAVCEEIKGPKAGAPPQAFEGFLRKTGLTQDQLVERGGIFFAVAQRPGRKTADILAEAIPAIIRAFPWPKSQRWGAASASTESLRWVRPLQGIIALLGDELVPFEVDSIASGNVTMGHRFHHSGEITIGNVADYAAKLRAAHVILDHEQRQNIIRDGAAKAAADAGLTLLPDEGLVIENAGLTEWPVPMLGRFDAAFLKLPPEVIQLTARVNQKYFVCRDAHGRLANAFVCTANIEASDGGAAIIAGNEKVLAARLSDAKFFWETDLKIPLETQAAKLSNIVFHEKLGTIAGKVERVAKLARWLVEEGIVKSSPERGGEPAKLVEGQVQLAADLQDNPNVPLHHLSDGPPPRSGEDLAGARLAAQAERAARLCKADLVTGMVGEFPELQGIIGGYYARAQLTDLDDASRNAIADAVRDHYKPVGQGDDVPTAPVTVAVSLADKLDSLVGFFVVGILPTGSKDPFALRRAALGILAIILENKLRCNFVDLVSRARRGFETLADYQETTDKRTAYDKFLENLGMRSAFSEIKKVWLVDWVVEDFVVDRLKVQQREAGVRHDLIDAVFALGGEDDLVRLLARVKALQAFVTTQEGANLLAGYKRAANILKANTSGKNNRHPELDSGSISPNGTSVDAQEWMLKQVQHDGVGEVEVVLFNALLDAETKASDAIALENFEAAMSALAILRTPIDAFFDKETGVMVNDPDPDKRAFRLGLLTRFRDAVHQVADFSIIEG